MIFKIKFSKESPWITLSKIYKKMLPEIRRSSGSILNINERCLFNLNATLVVFSAKIFCQNKTGFFFPLRP